MSRLCEYLLPIVLAIVTLIYFGQPKREEQQPADYALQPTGVYYWCTTLGLTNVEYNWLKRNDIQRVYLRLFDITSEYGEPRPNASLKFLDIVDSTGVHHPGNVEDVLGDIEIVPTVFIVEDVFRNIESVDTLAKQMAQRVKKMGVTRHFKFSEIQLDCDWTATTRDAYFGFLTALRRELPGVRLSSTIRLHQLNQPVPPVDSGVLMVYNTGDIYAAPSDRNPILDLRDVKPYLPRLRKYDLPLSAAYPNFSWQLLYAGKELKGILYNVDLDDKSTFAPTGPGRYKVVAARTITMSMGGSTIHLLPGEEVRAWRVSPEALHTVCEAVEKARPGINANAIIYHLDEDNLLAVPTPL